MGVLTCRGGELEGAEAYVVESLVVENHTLVGVLNELVHRESGVVGLHDGVRDLRRREDGKCEHHTVGILLPDLRNEKGAHAGPGSSSQRVTHLKSYIIQDKKKHIIH